MQIFVEYWQYLPPFLAEERLDEGVEFGILLSVEFVCVGTQFFLERCFRVGVLELGIETGAIILQPEAEFGYVCALFGCHGGKLFVGVALGADDFGCHTADFAKRAHIGEFVAFCGCSVKIAGMGYFVGLLDADFEYRAVWCAVLLLAHDNSAIFLKFSVHLCHGGV